MAAGDRASAADGGLRFGQVWKRADETLGQLSGGILEPALVDARDAAGESRFPRDARPFVHQLSAWRSAEAGRSYMVTSGIGSGKTGSFMMPMLNDLLRQAGVGRLHGTHAIIVYPLNALIDSQRERLGVYRRVRKPAGLCEL